MTNALSPTMIGLDAPGPGISVFQARLAEGDQVDGSESESDATPEPSGPRKRDQSPACKSRQLNVSATVVDRRRSFIRIGSLTVKQSGVVLRTTDTHSQIVGFGFVP